MKVLLLLDWMGKYERHNDRFGGKALSNKGKVTVAIFKLIPFFDWQPVKRFEKRSSVFMSAFVKSSFGCTILNRASTFAVVLRLRTNK